MNTQTFAQLFPLGTHLCREPMPDMAEMKRDMELLKKQGFNLIKLQEHWMIDEPVEGRCDFSRYEELIEHAAKLDLGIYLGLTCEQAPGWLWRKHPDCRMVGRSGLPIAYEAQTTLPADGKPGPCFDHPGAMEDQLRFIGTLVRTLGRFENIVVWNTWQEVGYWADGLVGQHVCYCPHTLRHYRGWLRDRFGGDLDALNRTWKTRYATWEDILPERMTRPSAVAQDLWWRAFMDNEQIAHVLRMRAAAVRAADPLRRPVFTHKGGPMFGSTQDWTYARCQDFLGSSTYPGWSATMRWDDANKRPFTRHASLYGEMWWRIAMCYDYIRSANPDGAPVWAAEFQGGPVSVGLHRGRTPSPDDIRRWMLTAAGAGVSAISFWVTRAEIMVNELNGFSLLDSSGETTPRLEEAGRVGRALNRFPDLFGQPTLEPAPVGILVDEGNYHMGNAVPDASDHLNYALRGWYRYLWDAGIRADFVSTEHVDAASASRYKALIFPFPLAVADSVAERLAAYVEAGGHLISEAYPGRVNECGFCARGEISPRLSALFGARHAGSTMVREPGDASRWSPAEWSWGEYAPATLLTGRGPLANHRLRPNFHLQTLIADGGSVVLKRGADVAGVMRRVGSGSAWLLGTYVGHGATAHRHEPTARCVEAILARCGVPARRLGELLLRRRVGADREAWLLTNPGEKPATASIDLAGWKHAEDLLGERIRRTGRKVRLTVDSLDVRVLIVSR